MSFVGDPFRFDIFISYSHGPTPESGESKLLAWARAFWRELDRELKAHFDLAGVELFFDKSPRPGKGIDPFVKLDAQLEQHVRTSAFLLALVSPGYCQSDWCRQERRWWLDEQSRHGRPLNPGLMPALIWAPAHNGNGRGWEAILPEHDMKDLLGIAFFDPTGADMAPQPFGWAETGAEHILDTRFHKALIELAGRLRLNLRNRRDSLVHAAAALAPPGPKPGEKPTVYLHGRDDQRADWDATADRLAEAGFPLSTDMPEPVDPDPVRRAAIREQRIEALARSDALLMLAPPDPATYSEELRVLGKSDRGEAIDRAERRNGQPGKRLPGAVVDQVAEADRQKRRQMTARNLQLGWLNGTDPAWINAVDPWFAEAMR